MWNLFVKYPNREPVLRELPLPQSLADLRASLEVFEDQHLLVDDPGKGGEAIVQSLDQLSDGAVLSVAVPRRRIFVSCLDQRGAELQRQRPVVWYPGAEADQIEGAIVKACGLPPGTPIELLDGDDAVVISPTIPNDLALTVVPLDFGGAGTARQATNGVARREVSSNRASLESPRRRVVGAAAAGGGGGCGGPPGGGRAASAARSNAASPNGGTRRGPNGSSATAPPAGPREPSPVTRTSSSGQRTSPSRSVDALAVDVQGASKTSAPDEHCVHILAGHAGFVLALCTVGDVLFTGSQDSNIMIWDLNNLQYIGTLPGHRGFVKCLAATISRKLLCSGSQDRTIRVWSLETFSCTKTLPGHSSEVNSLALLEGQSGGDVLVSGGEDRSIRVWDLTSLSLLASVDQAHQSGIFSLVQLDAGTILSGSRDRTMKVWLASTWQARRALHPPHYDGVTGIVAAARKGRFYSVSRDRSIRRWDSRTYKSDLQLTHAHGDWLTCAVLSPSEELLFSGGKDCTVRVWDADLHVKDVLVGHKGPISALLTIDDHLFSASHDRTVRVWQTGGA